MSRTAEQSGADETPFRQGPLETETPLYYDQKQVLSGILHGANEVFHEVNALLSAGAASFPNPAFSEVYAAYERIVAAGGEIDRPTLIGELAGKLKALTPEGMIDYLWDMDYSQENAAHYARKVADAALKRSVSYTLYHLYNTAQGWGGDAKSLVDEVQRQVLAVDGLQEDAPVRFRDIVPAHWDEFVSDYRSPRTMRGLPTGLSQLNRITQGFTGKDVIIVKAKTGIGKSIISANIAVAAGKEADAAGHIYSLEMAQNKVLRRMVFAEANVPASAYRDRTLTPDQWQKLKDAHGRLSRLRLSLFDDAGMTLPQIASHCRRAHLAGELDFVIVDYAQLVTPPKDRKEANREQEVREISRTLKVLASDLDIPVILVSQINDDGKIRESRALGHDASIVLHLEELIEEGKTLSEGESREARPFTLTVEKNRDGARAKIDLTFMPEMTLFTERAENEFGGF